MDNEDCYGSPDNIVQNLVGLRVPCHQIRRPENMPSFLNPKISQWGATCRESRAILSSNSPLVKAKLGLDRQNSESADPLGKQFPGSHETVIRKIFHPSSPPIPICDINIEFLRRFL